jgi:hypothetical protein
MDPAFGAFEVGGGQMVSDQGAACETFFTAPRLQTGSFSLSAPWSAQNSIITLMFNDHSSRHSHQGH